MDSFNLKLERIGSAKEAIKTSLTNKGMSPSDNIEDYAQIIDSIESGSGDVKQFATIEEMQADTTAKEGDLAVVYRSEIKNVTVDSKFQTATFPDIVVLDTAITNYVEISYRAVDSSKMFDCMGSLDSSSFMVDCYTESGEIRIQYTSSDGITYTRTDSTGNPVDFGTEIYCARTEYWNDAIGKFIQVGGMYFEGLYAYGPYTDTDNYIIFNNCRLTYDNQWVGNYDILTEELSKEDYTKIDTILKNTITTTINKTLNAYLLEKISDTVYRAYMQLSGSTLYRCGFVQQINGTDTASSLYIGAYIGLSGSSLNPIYIYEINLSNNTGALINTITSMETFKDRNNNTTEYLSDNIVTQDRRFVLTNNISIETTGTDIIHSTVYCDFIQPTRYKYMPAPTQLSATPEYVYGKEFYGQNGVEVGTLGTPNNSFVDTNAEIVYKIQNAYENMEPRVLTDDNKAIDRNIYFIPVKKDGTVLLDTSNITNATWMFQGCSNLTTIPQLNTSKVTNMQYMFTNCKNLTEVSLLDTSKVTDMLVMFQDCINLTTVPQFNLASVKYISGMFSRCPNLSDESLNNILAMFANATSYKNEKTLEEAGLTEEQATRCQSLSNYSVFTAAGWTTGY